MSSKPNKNPAGDLLEWPIPQVGESPITGVTGTLFWGGLNKPDARSRWVIGDSDLDDAPNLFPQQVQLQQLPYIGATVATLPSPAIWMSAQVLNANLYNFFLCQNGHIYQVSTSGTITDVYAAGSFTQSGVLNGTTTVTGLTTAVISAGMFVSGTGIQPGTTVVSVVNSTTITISLAATLSGTENLTFSPPLFSSISDITNWQGGTDILFSDGVAENVYAWNGTALTLALTGQPSNFIVTYGDRLWLFTKTTITWTMGGTYNSLSGDSGSASIGDAGANTPILGAVSSLGVIMLFGSNWIGTISNLAVTGSPAILTFNFVILSGAIGAFNRFGVIPFSNAFYFANNYGIWQLAGSAPTKISPQLDGFFSSLDFTKTTFSAAYVEIFNTPCLLWQAYYMGDSNVAAGYTVFGCTLINNVPNQWFRMVQGTIALISGLPAATVASGLPNGWGCDGTNIFPLLDSETTSYTAQLDTKIWDFYSKVDIKTFDYVFVSCIVTEPTTFTLQMVNESGNVVFSPPSQVLPSPGEGEWINNAGVQGLWINNASVTGSWQGISTFLYVPVQFGLTGGMRGLGLNLTFVGAAIIIQAIVVGYRRTTGSRGPGYGQ